MLQINNIILYKRITAKILFVVLLSCVFCVNLISQVINDYSIQQKNDFRFTLGGGYAYHLGKIEKMNEYEFLKKLRHGFNLEISAQKFYKSTIGFGFNTIYIKQHMSEPDKYIPTTIGFDVLKTNETTQFFYIGPSFVISTNPDKITYYGEIGAGLLLFSDVGEYYIFKGSITRPTVGVHTGFSAEYKISSMLGFGLMVSMTAGLIRTSFYEERKKTYNVSNATIGAFISFRTK